jgi:chitinase
MPRDDIALGGYYMHLRMTDKEGFLKFIAEAGIPEEWITFDETVEFDEECHLPAGPNPSCPTTSGHKRYVGYPKKKSSVNVPNPKDIVTSGIGNVDELRNMTIAHRLEISLGIYDGNPDDVIQVISVPVFLLEQAIEGMGKAKELADKQEEMDRDAQKNLILTIVGAVLFIVPFAGAGGAAALGATSLARVLLIIGEAANIAYTVYGVVDDPDSALMAVMGLLMGAAGATRGPRTPTGFKDMATKRAKLTSTASLGSGFKTKDDTLQRIITTTCKR